jgi:hypothetical protein
MSTASTDNQRNKRVRIDTDNNKVYDYTFLANSVSTLLPTMKGLVSHYYDAFIKLSKSIYEKKNVSKKFTNPDFIPKSAKTKFQLGASEMVKMSNDFQDLARAADQVKIAYEAKQKQHILQAAKLEIEVLQHKLNNLFIKGIYKISSMMLLWKTEHQDVVEAEVHHIVRELIQMTIHY